MNRLLSRIKSALIFEVIPGQKFPRRHMWLYGVALRHPARDTAFAMPIPLNLFAGVVRNAWARMRYPSRWMRFGSESAAYAAGRRDAMRDRITDDDIAAYMLRKKIEEANGSLSVANEAMAQSQAALNRLYIRKLCSNRSLS